MLTVVMMTTANGEATGIFPEAIRDISSFPMFLDLLTMFTEIHLPSVTLTKHMHNESFVFEAA